MDRMVFLHIGARTAFTVCIIGPFLPLLMLADMLVWPLFGYGFIGWRECAGDHIAQFKRWCGWHLCKSNVTNQPERGAR
jgi:hypothetical protein